MSPAVLSNTVALVTGANRGIGAAFVDGLVSRGAAKVYATARRLDSLAPLVERHGDRIEPLVLDVTDPAQVRAAAHRAGDVRILVNNAGVAGTAGVPATHLDSAAFERNEFEVNVFGLLSVTRAFIPVLQSNGGGAIVNLGSVASFVNFPLFQTYSASKAAVHSLTQALRVALPGTLVVGVYPGAIETDMAADVPLQKSPPAEVVRATLDALEAGEEDVLPDAMAQQLGAGFFADPKGLERQVQQMAAALSPA